ACPATATGTAERPGPSEQGHPCRRPARTDPSTGATAAGGVGRKTHRIEKTVGRHSRKQKRRGNPPRLCKEPQRSGGSATARHTQPEQAQTQQGKRARLWNSHRNRVQLSQQTNRRLLAFLGVEHCGGQTIEANDRKGVDEITQLEL